MARSCLAVVLAAGEGTRMKSSMIKVLHPVGNLPVICHVMKAASGAGADTMALVLGRDADAVRDAAVPYGNNVSTFVQEQRLGTGSAVLAARTAIAKGFDDVLVIFGDTPLIGEETLGRARAALAAGADVAVIGFRTENPFGYGRLLESDGELVAIREHKDATDEERAINFCNAGLMAISGDKALSLLDAIDCDNAKGEYYLTDVVEISRRAGGKAVAIDAPWEELIGIDTRVGLAEAESLWQQRRRRELMLAGVSMTAPETVFVSHDTVISPDVLLEPNVVIGPGVEIGAGATIHAFSHLEGATVGANCSVGPFARLRPGADMQDRSKVGNFCEVKKAVIGEAAKVNHLTYVGDAFVGAGANLGAGTITCNYDGVNKHVTTIGQGAFVGSNSALVAPVTIGNNAYVASGSVVTMNVPDDALAFGRARQVNKDGLATTLRRRNEDEKQRRQNDNSQGSGR
ncbi:MAG: bifunctional UDP-N-acetylglucosamine diphosphorylase/glucosamine-1-phosphate N-acetyltransferase GlmU [Alphaproteobacteria bacterium]|nr:bifunctional UDP-N-acetylglucosamine diphosphorylase/glucosamine-1-phosphate N-acetyltransferase GlmU [Alphaproteobacteria bacterium]